MRDELVKSVGCRRQRELLNEAVRCESTAARFVGDDPGRVRAREIVIGLGAQMRAAAGVFDTDPTLTDPSEEYSGRMRSVDLLAELVRQLQVLVRRACESDCGHRRQPAAELWAEVEALFRRCEEIASSIPELVPRRDHATRAGQQAISCERLAARRDALARAAATVRAAAEPATQIENPDPRAIELVALAERLDQIAGELDEFRAPDVLPAAVHSQTVRDRAGSAIECARH
jgi:hypothetical protein